MKLFKITTVKYLSILTLSCTATHAQIDTVSGFDEAGWNADDVRDSSGTNITNGTTHDPATGATLDATQVANQIDWDDYVGSWGNLGGVRFDTSASGSQKSTLSVIDTSTGFIAAQDLLDPSFSASYRWQNNDTVAAGVALKFGIQSVDYGTGSGESQEGFDAARSGEGTWDLVLVYDPTNNGINSTTDGRLYTSEVTADSKFFLFPQAGSSYFTNTYGADADSIGISAGSKTLAEWQALDIDGAAAGTTTWGDLIFDGSGDAKVSNVQFGMGSGNDNATTTLDYAEISFLNNGERIDFVDAARYDGLGTDSADYSDSSNWSGATPGSTQNLIVDTTGTTGLTVSAVNQETRSLGILNGTTNLGINSGSTLTLNSAENGTLSVAEGATLNVSGDGALSAGVVEVDGAMNIAVSTALDGGADPHPQRDGLSPTATSRYGIAVYGGGELTLQNGADVTVSQNNLNAGVRVGDDADGTATMNVETGASLQIGNDTDYGVSGLTSNGFFTVGAWGSTGIVNQTGGSVTLTDGSFNLGNQAGTGTYNLSDGTLTLEGGLHSLGRNTGSRAAGSGTLNISGGTMTLRASTNNGNGSYIFGDRDNSDTDGSGLVHQTGGTIRVEGSSNLYLGGYGSSTYNLEGGTLEIGGNSLKGFYGSAGTNGGSYDFNLQGGTIKVIDSNLSTDVAIDLVDIDPTSAVTTSVVDTNGFDATFSGAINGDGGLVKAGTGSLNLQTSDRTAGYLSVEGGSVNHLSGTTTTGAMLIGAYPSLGTDSNGTFTLTDGTVNVAGPFVYIGSGSSGNNTGVLNIDAGTLNLGSAGAPETRVDFYNGAFGSTGSATVNQTGGTINKLTTDGVFHIGNQSGGTYNLSGGAINIYGDNGMVLGRSGSSAGAGVLNISDGEINFFTGTDLLLGGAQGTEPLTGSGTVNQTGGVVTLNDGGNLILGQQGDGIYNLDGGTLQTGGTNRIQRGAGSVGTLSMGGGTLRVIGTALTVANAVDIELKAASNSTIDTNGLGATIGSDISGSGGLIKTGLGSLILNGNNSYTGATLVSNGLLRVEGSLTGTSSLTVESGAAIGGSGTIGVFTSISGELTPGSSPGIATYSAGLSLADTSTSTFEFISETTDLADRGVEFDGVNVSGDNLTIDPSATLALVFDLAGSTVDFSSVFWDSSQQWLLFDSAFGTIVSGDIFGDVTVSLDSQGQSFATTGGFFTVTESNSDIYLNYVVPEPSMYAALIGMFTMAWVMVRRRRK
ncbi:hypothetical protein DDZ13_08475 [Coraliomargarita sinensis]|uniref:PEP-CTERM protein-sorting domain-containing protein n=1 Tax=Coraliomargarita sinensis TaxID=2174842 RepID=A0A317ZEZ8_9BACT|nr:autotransporter-associated beta strand repeat-containing protein [Coraliomargarita sinensis]PXA04065.1 hypothetical protein DDZ13_08475 [Coraliomargarita sinensis]